MKDFKYEVGAVVILNDKRGTTVKVVDRIEAEPRVYILETEDQRRYELTEDDIKGLV